MNVDNFYICNIYYYCYYYFFSLVLTLPKFGDNNTLLLSKFDKLILFAFVFVFKLLLFIVSNGLINDFVFDIFTNSGLDMI